MKTVLKLLVFYILSFLSPIDSIKQDSISLPKVEIYAAKSLSEKQPDILLQGNALDLHNGYSLSDVLSSQANLYIRNYGPGTVATISMRGSGPTQTQLSWNDMPIASPTLGLSDFSLIHSNLFDGIQIYSGNNSAEYGSGAIGGRINLLSQLASNDSKEIKIDFSKGSFGLVGSSVRIKQPLKKFSLTTSGSFVQSNNDFDVKLGPSNIKKQTNAAFRSFNFLQGIDVSLNEHSSLGLQIWAIVNDRLIPPTITQNFSKSAQQDQSIKALIEYRNEQDTWSTNFKLGYILEDQAYQDSLIGLFTENDFDQLFAQAGVIKKISNYKFSLKSQYLNHKATTGNYTSQIDQSRFSNVLGLEWDTKRFNTKLRSRIISVDNHWKSPISQLTINGVISKGIELEYQLGQLFRLPTLNDLYWRPGGNELLSEETGYESSLGISFVFDSDHFHLSLNSDFYYRDVNDWILWAIQEGTGLWGATNLGRVESKGADVNVAMSYLSNKLTFKYTGNIEWLSSVNKEAITFPNIEVGQQLFYTPKRRMSQMLSLETGNSNIYMSVLWQDESIGINEDIESSTIINFGTSTGFPVGKVKAKLYFKLNNILNKNFFIIERRPMPGRNFMLGLQLNL